MLFGKKDQLIGLDIGSRTIKVAEVEGKKKSWHLKKLGVIDIAPGVIEEGVVRNRDAVTDAIRQLVKSQKIKEINTAISIGGYSTIVKNITVSKMEEAQLQETIYFEAEQYIPFDINDVNIDFQILGENETNPNQMNVLLVAAKKDMVKDYVELVQMAGLTPCIVDVDAFALQNIYEINYKNEEGVVALIDVGANKTTLNIVKGSFSAFNRDVSLGCHQINSKVVSLVGCSVEEAEQLYRVEDESRSSKEVVQIISTVVTDWCTEIRRALDFFYSTYPDDQIRKIVLSGGGGNISKFRQLLSVETSSDVELIHPFEHISVDGSLDPSFLEQIGPQAAICLGLAIRRIGDK
jgi:type IV pilus assembly protein PilM